MAPDAEQRSPLRERVPAPPALGRAATRDPTLRAELVRKAIHLGSAVLPIGWAQGWLAAAQLRGLLLAAVGVAALVELLRASRPAFGARFLAWLGPLLREPERRGITGATWLALGMCAVVVLAPTRSAIVALWAAAVGDASGALVGRALQAARARWPDGASAAGKSLAGSAAVCVSTALGATWLLGLAVPVAAALGLVAAAAEWPRRPFDDNLRVTLAVALAAVLLGLG